MALWNLLGARGVDVLAWESFGQGWVTDITKQLKLPNTRAITAPYGELPDLSQVDFNNDVVFTWNGTTSGALVPNGDWIPANRAGLTICDATSAAFAMELPWDKLDVVTWSWQKVLGGEAAHGMLALSPRAVERLLTYKPAWPLPKIFRLLSGGKLIEGIFAGETINTPSMLCVEDALDSLKWAESIGGLPATIARCDANLATVATWVSRTPWIEFLARDPAIRSTTAIQLVFTAPWFTALDPAAQMAAGRRITTMIEQENAGYDFAAHRDSPPGLRIWGGATVEASDIAALLPWIEWAFSHVAAEHATKAAE